MTAPCLAISAPAGRSAPSPKGRPVVGGAVAREHARRHLLITRHAVDYLLMLRLQLEAPPRA